MVAIYFKLLSFLYPCVSKWNEEVSESQRCRNITVAFEIKFKASILLVATKVVGWIQIFTPGTGNKMWLRDLEW